LLDGREIASKVIGAHFLGRDLALNLKTRLNILEKIGGVQIENNG